MPGNFKKKRLSDYLFKWKRKNVALALSSGGARGLAHIGAIDALQSRGYRITSISGTSMGALVAAMFASGHLEEFKQWMSHINKRDVHRLTDYTFSISHMVKGVRIIDELKKIAPDCDIESLDIPFSAVATDWNTGKEVVFSSGSMWEAVRASISVPGFFEPVGMGDQILIDGGVTNPLPLDHVKRSGDGLLVGVNVSGYDYEGIFKRKKEMEKEEQRTSKPLAFLKKMLPGGVDPALNYYTLLGRTVSIAISQNAYRSILINRPDMIVDIPMVQYSGSDYDKYEGIRELGEMLTLEAIDKFVREHHKFAFPG